VQTDKRGYPIPINAEPPDDVCIKVYIPNDQLYIDQFWNAYGYFAQWSAWVRDPLKRGRLAARRWLESYFKARDEWWTHGGCAVAITNLRQNPLDPCKLEFSEDGIVWTQFADLSLCGGSGGGSGDILRWNGTVMQRYDPCDGLWHDIGEPFDPIVDGIIPPENILPDLSGQCDGAANIAAYIESIDDVIVGAMVTTDNVLVSILQAATYLLAVIPETRWLSALTEGFRQVDEVVGQVWADIAAVPYEAELRSMIFQNLQHNGTFTADGFAQLQADLYARVQQSQVMAETGRWNGLRDIVAVLGAVGLSKANKFAGITGADCSTDGWLKVFDFTLNAQGWGRFVSLNTRFGEFVPGEGWRTTYADNGAVASRCVNIERGFPVSHVDSVSYVFNAELGQLGGGVHYALRTHTYPFADAQPVLDDHVIVAGDDQSYTFAIDADVTGIAFELNVGTIAGGAGDPGGVGLVKRVTLRGSGLNPFD